MRPWVAALTVVAAAIGAVIGLVNVFTAQQDERTLRHDIIDFPLRPDKPVALNPANVAVARRAAIRYWHRTRCTRPVPITEGRLPAERIAQAHWHYDTNVPQVYFGCLITFNGARRFSYQVFCAAMVHEYGHLAGWGRHSTRPTDIMFATLTRRNIPGVCR